MDNRSKKIAVILGIVIVGAAATLILRDSSVFKKDQPGNDIAVVESPNDGSKPEGTLVGEEEDFSDVIDVSDNDQRGADLVETALPCGDPASEVKARNNEAGWEQNRIEQLCLVVSHPEGWRFVSPRLYPAPDPIPYAVFVPAENYKDLTPALISSVAFDEDVNGVGLTPAEISAKGTSIGGSTVGLYEFSKSVSEKGGIKVEYVNYIMIPSGMRRAYLVKAAFMHGEVLPSGEEVKRDVLKMLRSATAY